MIVHKFGGTSVGNAECFARVASIVSQRYGTRHGPRPEEPVVVVSAMSGVTDQLIAGARAAAEGKDNVYREIKARLLARHLEVIQTLLASNRERLEVGGLVEDQLHELERLYRSIAVLGELTLRGCDTVSSFGERLSANILAAVLREQHLHAEAIHATELIVTDDRFGQAAPLMEPTRQRLEQRVKPLLQRGTIPVITGYIGATEKGVTTTLGRGGSDLSAAIIGVGLSADEVWIWSDVDGILTADPNIVPGAHTLAELSYTEAANLAYFGADVLHPKTIRPLVQPAIALRILNTFRPSHTGTLIVKTPSATRRLLPAIISTTALSLIAVGGGDKTWSLHMATRALRCLSEAGVNVLMFSQSFSEQNLNLVVREQDQAHCLSILSREFGNDSQRDGCSLETKESVATISVVGASGWSNNGIAPLAFAALGKFGTRVIAVAQATNESSVSFCIPEDQVRDTVRFLHRELGLEAAASSG